MSAIKEQDREFDLLNSFHQQFAENQNHLQTVFIQFISAVLAILVGYGYVYTNTDVKAALYAVCKHNEALVSYSLHDLIGSYVIAQTILGLLVTLTANIGYGFRRDQFVNFNIRHKYLGHAAYKEIFPPGFDPCGKELALYLPEFNRMFIYALVIIQLFLTLSILIPSFNFEPVNRFELLDLLFWLPLIWSVRVYFLYYRKYKKACRSNRSD